ncbi:MAG: hypothetical protein AABW88_01640 [Nanoarchaeota archaeon]
MTEKEGKVKFWRDDDGKLKVEASGASGYCVEVIKGFDKQEKDEEVTQAGFTELQEAKMFSLKKEEREIVNIVKRHNDQYKRYPTPKQIQEAVPQGSRKSQINQYTRMINKMPKFFKFDGKNKGKKVCFTDEFLK